MSQFVIIILFFTLFKNYFTIDFKAVIFVVFEYCMELDYKKEQQSGNFVYLLKIHLENMFTHSFVLNLGNWFPIKAVNLKQKMITWII